MTGTRLVARCVRGLEHVVTEEILRERGGAVRWIGHREIHWEEEVTESAPVLRTADDVFLFVNRVPDIGRTREHLPGLAGLVSKVDLHALLERRRSYTGVGAGTGIEASASFLGKRTYNRYDVEDTLGAQLSEVLGVDYFSRRGEVAPPPGGSGWRLTLDGEWATLMLRVFPRPLHRREYKQASVVGTVRPPVAAAIAAMAELEPDHTVLDPCCGAGTLLIEAGELQPDADIRGFDLDPVAVRAARENARNPRGKRPRIEEADAARLPLPDASVDRVVSNPPWGGQVPPAGRLAGSPGRWWREVRRVLRPEGRAVVLLADTRDLTVAIANGLAPSTVRRLRINGAPAHIVALAPTPEPTPAPRPQGQGRPKASKRRR
ncbi:methyltransferase domain-containing protein [Spiractinospora alimapuensis]|uniref:TRM11 family SAM-dependent methyltransferase n=1 Tax=Spiractinospora alimapuensis TaxID=2820884 RepID=UPI001F3D40F2|nr:methyltransferase domain-containing protein [Spiractinospora alimapuensis]QVQ51796.1 methyltransferase domain-containing protein [Spiractinospora alimapuensis]